MPSRAALSTVPTRRCEAPRRECRGRPRRDRRRARAGARRRRPGARRSGAPARRAPRGPGGGAHARPVRDRDDRGRTPRLGARPVRRAHRRPAARAARRLVVGPVAGGRATGRRHGPAARRRADGGRPRRGPARRSRAARPGRAAARPRPRRDVRRGALRRRGPGARRAARGERDAPGRPRAPGRHRGRRRRNPRRADRRGRRGLSGAAAGRHGLAPGGDRRRRARRPLAPRRARRRGPHAGVAARHRRRAGRAPAPRTRRRRAAVGADGGPRRAAGRRSPAARGERGHRGRAAGGPADGDAGRRVAGPARDAGRRRGARRPDGAPRDRRPACHRRDHRPPPHATATATATAEPTPTPTPGPAVAAKLDGRWCDTTTVCDHRLGFTFARGTRGYRSLAGPATDAAPFGTREISSPVDAGVAADARAREAVRQGGYAQLAGDAFALRDGIGDDGSSTTQAIAFSADGTTGFTGGTAAFGAGTAARPPTVADAPLPPLGDAIVAAAASPNGDGRIFAMSRQGGALLYTPDRGWLYPETALTPTQAHGRFTALRAVAWPRRNLMIGVGSAGALVTSLRDPLPFDLMSEGSGDPRGQIVPYEGLPVEATLLAVACNATDPVECTAVGRNGLIVRGDGTRWHVEQLPGDAPATTDITSVAYDGRTPLAATTAGLYRGDGDGRWTRDEGLHAALEASGRPPAVVRVATEPGGGTVVDGRFERDAPTAPWRRDERAAGAASRGDRRLPRRRPGPDDRLRGRVGAAAPGAGGARRRRPRSPDRPGRSSARPRAARRVAGRRRGAARDGRRLGRSRRHELSAVRRSRSPADDVQHARVRPRPGRHRPGARRARRRGDQPARARSGRGVRDRAPVRSRRPRSRPSAGLRARRDRYDARRRGTARDRRARDVPGPLHGRRRPGPDPRCPCRGGDHAREVDGRGRGRPGRAAVRRWARLARRRGAGRGRRPPLPAS